MAISFSETGIYSLKLSSGRIFMADGGVLGLCVNDSTTVYGGCPEKVFFGETPLTPDERREIAEHMIGMWKTYGGLAG